MKKLMILTLGLLVSTQSFALDLNKVKCGAEDLDITFTKLVVSNVDFGFANENPNNKLLVTINGQSTEAKIKTIEISNASMNTIKLDTPLENIASLKIGKTFSEISGEFTTIDGIKLGINCIEFKR